MTEENLQRAKEIFFKYACNHFFLDREVDAEEYKNFDVSHEQENKWIREYVSYWTSKLSVEDFQALNSLSATEGAEALPEMFRISELGDSFSKLSYANAIWKIALGCVMSPISREHARRKSISLWQSLLNSPIKLTEDHRKKISENIGQNTELQKTIAMARESSGLAKGTIARQDTTPEESILNSAKSKLKEANERNAFYFLFVSLFMGIVSVASAFIDLIDKINRLGKGQKS